MSVENIVAGVETRQKQKEAALKHNKAIAAVKELGLDEDVHNEIVGHIKQSYVDTHAKIAAEGINLDAPVDYVPKTRTKKVKSEEKQVDAPATIEAKAPPAAPAKPAKSGKGKPKDDEDPAA